MRPTPEQLTQGFFCPLCRSNHYMLVSVTSQKSGARAIVDGLFQCAGCTVVFTDPVAFTQLMSDTIVDEARYHGRRPTREYPPDAVTVRRKPWKP